MKNSEEKSAPMTARTSGEEEKSPMEEGENCRKPTVPMLINHLSRMFDMQMKTIVPDRTGCMTQNSCRFIMRYLARYEDATQQELTAAAEMKAPTISVAIKRMEAEGLVRRQTDERDLRCVRVSLTEAGRAYDREVRRALDTMDERMMQGVTPEEEVMLREVLLRMRENLRAGGASEHR